METQQVNYNVGIMEALELMKIVIPEHDRTSCSDENTANGFYSLYGYNDDGKWMGRCRRCMLLEIVNNNMDVPKGIDLTEVI